MQTPTKKPFPSLDEQHEEYEERNQIWETSHIAITTAMAQLIRENERWPTKAELAQAMGLSRPTVYLHLKHFRQEDLMGTEMGQLKYIASKIFATLTTKAMDGDIKAMRLSFEVMGILKKRESWVSPESLKEG